MNQVWAIYHASGEMVEVYSAEILARHAIKKMIENDRQNFFDTFGDFDGNFDNYQIVTITLKA
jgi:hypothetical protein